MAIPRGSSPATRGSPSKRPAKFSERVRRKAVLAIDTTLGACSAAVGDTTGPRAARFEETGTGQAERLIPMIDSVLREAGLAAGELGRIAVTIGPGSFAGTRIGLAAARAMALVLEIPLIGMTSLEAVAVSVHEAVPRIVAFDARKGELYVQAFGADLSAGGTALAVSLDQAVEALGPIPEDTLLLGSGAPALGARLGLAGAVRPPLWPSAADFIAFAARKPVDADLPARPLYLRAPGATPYRRLS